MSIGEDILEALEKLAVEEHKAPKDYDYSTLPTLDEVGPHIPCGSVLLCSGTASESRLIEETDGTDFSHSAMIVRFHDHPDLYLWSADTVDRLDDQIHKEANPKHPGTHLLNLKDYMTNMDVFYPSPDGSKYRFAIARLKNVEVDESKLWSTMYAYDGTPFPSTKDELLHYIEGQLDIDTGMLSSFCAQMVANTYQQMGWMKKDRPPNAYNPGEFSKTKKINRELLAGAELGPAVYIKV
jgi:hypothetical protein